MKYVGQLIRVHPELRGGNLDGSDAFPAIFVGETVDIEIGAQREQERVLIGCQRKQVDRIGRFSTIHVNILCTVELPRHVDNQVSGIRCKFQAVPMRKS